jgi:ubiquitin-protein ligase
MQSYQSLINTNKNSIIQRLSFIEKIFKIYYFKIQEDVIEITFNVNELKYKIHVYYEKNKPTFIFANINNKNIFENKLSEQLNIINLQIDNYEYLDDVLYDITTTLNELENKLELYKNDKNIEEIVQKDNISFIEEVEKHKINLKKTTISNKIMSSNSIIEMLGDQLIKLNSNKNYLVEIKDLRNFTVELSNFNLNNTPELDIQNLKVIINMNLSTNIISSSPKISITSNYIFKNNILSVIEKLKPFSDSTKWSIKYSIYDICENIYQMIVKYGELDAVAKTELDGLLIEMEYLLSIKNDNISENKLLLEFDEILANELAGFINKSNNNATYWKSGTGYGSSKSSNWNIDDYANNLKLRKIKINEKMNNIFILINKLKKLESFEVDKLKSIFKHYMLDTELVNKIVSEIATIIVNYQGQFNDGTVIKQIKEHFEENNIEHPITKLVKDTIMITSNLDDFQKIFNDYKFKYFESEFNNFHYQKNDIINLSANQVSRIQKEFQILKKSITLHKDASIFFCIQKNNINKIRFLVSGPKDTPYELGLYIFDMTMPSDFPSKPPLVNFSNNGGKRFNPNLYDSGKVCLSLLGTWRGDKGESWNINTSTFNQLVISIQAQILIDEPYFNEPGFEKIIGTDKGKKMSQDYNNNIRQYNLDHTMIDLLEKNYYPEFKEIIVKYFKFQKENIIKTLNKWTEEMPSSKVVAFQKSYCKFVNLVNKL